MSTVDIVIPCYKYAHYLEQCVDTVLSQRDVAVRALIIDDCSPDDTEAVGRRLAARDTRISFRRNARNLGLIGTANEGGLHWAEAPYTLLLSADDGLAPGALARAVDVLDRHPEVSFAYGLGRFVTDTAFPDETDPGAADYQLIAGDVFVRRCFDAPSPVCTPTAIVRTGLQKQLGGYDKRLPHTSDLDLWMRLAAHGPVAAINQVQGFYRWHASNMSLEHLNGAMSDRAKRLDAFECARAVCAARFPAYDAWLTETRRAYGREAYWFASLAFERRDAEAVAQCLAFAHRCDPELSRSAVHWRYRLQSALGPDGARRVRQAWQKLRAKSEAAPAALPEFFGWIPDAASANRTAARVA